MTLEAGFVLSGGCSSEGSPEMLITVRCFVTQLACGTSHACLSISVLLANKEEK